MGDVTAILTAGPADPAAASRLMPLVYDELRRLAGARMAAEPVGHTLDATALVHEAYLRLADAGAVWNHRGHYYAAAGEAMRRILVEHARRRDALKRGGTRKRVPLGDHLAPDTHDSDILALDAALTRLHTVDPEAARLVQLRYFAGLTGVQAAEALGMAPRTADRVWSFAKAWLLRELGGAEPS